MKYHIELKYIQFIINSATMSLPNRFNYMYRTAILGYMQDDNDLQSKQQLAECSFPLFATNWSHDNFNSKLPSKLLNPTANREARKQQKTRR